MGEHVESSHMAVSENLVPMVGAPDPFGTITMGAMYTNVLVRPKRTASRAGTSTRRGPSPAAQAARDGIEIV